jgi:hypothetical protein
MVRRQRRWRRRRHCEDVVFERTVVFSCEPDLCVVADQNEGYQVPICIVAGSRSRVLIAPNHSMPCMESRGDTNV